MQRNRKKILVCCSECNVSYNKRIDSLVKWNNLCRICSNRKKVNEKIKGISRVILPNCIKCGKKSRFIKISNFCKRCFCSLKGESHHNYKKDRSTLSKKQERNDSYYKEWRKKVWERDNYTCQLKNENCCNKIEVHHIYEWKKYENLRYDINNGITLCKVHHPKKQKDVLLLIDDFNKIVNSKN